MQHSKASIIHRLTVVGYRIGSIPENNSTRMLFAMASCLSIQRSNSFSFQRDHQIGDIRAGRTGFEQITGGLKKGTGVGRLQGKLGILTRT